MYVLCLNLSVAAFSLQTKAKRLTVTPQEPTQSASSASPKTDLTSPHCSPGPLQGGHRHLRLSPHLARLAWPCSPCPGRPLLRTLSPQIPGASVLTAFGSFPKPHITEGSAGPFPANHDLPHSRRARHPLPCLILFVTSSPPNICCFLTVSCPCLISSLNCKLQESRDCVLFTAKCLAPGAECQEAYRWYLGSVEWMEVEGRGERDEWMEPTDLQ